MGKYTGITLRPDVTVAAAYFDTISTWAGLVTNEINRSGKPSQTDLLLPGITTTRRESLEVLAQNFMLASVRGLLRLRDAGVSRHDSPASGNRRFLGRDDALDRALRLRQRRLLALPADREPLGGR